MNYSGTWNIQTFLSIAFSQQVPRCTMFSKCTRVSTYPSIILFQKRRNAQGTQLDSSSALERFLLLPDLFLFVRLMKEERASLGLQPGRETDAVLDRPGTFSSRSWQPMSLTSNVPVHTHRKKYLLKKVTECSTESTSTNYSILTDDHNPVMCLLSFHVSLSFLRESV